MNSYLNKVNHILIFIVLLLSLFFSYTFSDYYFEFILYLIFIIFSFNIRKAVKISDSLLKYEFLIYILHIFLILRAFFEPNFSRVIYNDLLIENKSKLIYFNQNIIYILPLYLVFIFCVFLEHGKLNEKNRKIMLLYFNLFLMLLAVTFQNLYIHIVLIIIFLFGYIYQIKKNFYKNKKDILYFLISIIEFLTIVFFTYHIFK